LSTSSLHSFPTRRSSDLANSVLAVEAGASQIDGSLAGLGAGAGNTPTEVAAIAFERLGIETGVDTKKILDAADLLKGMADRLPRSEEHTSELQSRFDIVC